MDHILKHPLDGTLVDEPGTSTGPWPRYLIMTSSDEGKTLNTLSLFAIHRGVNGIAGGDVTVKRQFNDDIYLTCSKISQSDNLLKCVLFVNIAPVVVTPHRSLNSSKGVVRNCLREPTLTKLNKRFPVLLMYSILLLKGIIWRLKRIPLL